MLTSKQAFTKKHSPRKRSSKQAFHQKNISKSGGDVGGAEVDEGGGADVGIGGTGSG